MKRVISVFSVCCLLCCLLSVPAFAAERTYDLDELGMSIALSDDHVVFTRDIKSDDPNLSAYGLTKDGLAALMLERDIYLNAWDENINYEIIVTMIEIPFEDFNQLSDTTLTAVTSSWATEYESVGITYIKSDIYQHSQAKFIKIYISQPDNGDTVYGLQYYTVYDGKAINVTLQSYSGEIDSGKEAILKEIVDTVQFDTPPRLSAPPAQTAAFTYTDDNSGLSFTVPANWVEAPVNEERNYIEATFTSNIEEGMSIIYGSEDFWNELSESEKRQFSRSDADNSILTKADIAEMYGCKEYEVSMVTFSGLEYFCAEFINTGTVYGMTVSMPTTRLVRCENGYMYMFQFSGARSSEYYNDFKALMNSVVYPKISATDSGGDLWARFSFGNIIFSLIMTVAVYSLPIFIYRYAVLKQPVDTKKAKRITIIYGIIAFVVMSIIVFAINGSGAAGGAILLWSWVNYRVLVGGKKQKTVSFTQESIPPSDTSQNNGPSDDWDSINADEPIGENDAETINDSETAENRVSSERGRDCQPMIVFCHKCGNRLMPNSVFCNKCGAKIPDEAEG